MINENTVNGIDLKGLINVRNTLQENPGTGRIKFRAKHRWADGAHAYTTIQDFNLGGQDDNTRPAPFILESDEPTVLLGTNLGPGATEAVLHALASCLDATMIYHAAAQGVRIDHLEMDMEGDLDLRGLLGISEDVRNGFQEVRVTFHVSADASEEKIRELCELAQKRSPVFDIVTHPVTVNVTVDATSTTKAEVQARQSM